MWGWEGELTIGISLRSDGTQKEIQSNIILSDSLEYNFVILKKGLSLKGFKH